MMLRRNLTPLLLALMLVAALPMQGWAQGVMARVADAVVVCIGDHEGVVVLDIHGEEVTLLPGCPDCVPTHATPVGGNHLPGPQDVVLAPFYSQFTGKILLADAPAATWPRAPPV